MMNDSGVKYASIGKRFLAAFIDGIILSIVGTIVNVIIAAVLGGSGDAAVAVQAAGSLVGLLIGWAYFAIQESSPKQATIGKQAMGLLVTDMEGQPISFVKASIRHFSKILSALILFIGYIMAFFTEKKQALHDIIAGTLVLQK